ncbi:hypothetical protein M0802_007561 [Mischocyttarus mexicanus]|nr:hypothetical protein M0802_007561 [Mischocyttarus mexicanus]
MVLSSLTCLAMGRAGGGGRSRGVLPVLETLSKRFLRYNPHCYRLEEHNILSGNGQQQQQQGGLILGN